MFSISISICFLGKTDDAKVSEKGCLPPRSNSLQPCSDVSRDDSRKPPLSSSSSSSRGSQTSCSPGNPTTTFGFKKQTAILSGSATLGKLPKSLGSFQSSRSAGLCRQSSVDDAYLPVSSSGSSIGVSRGSLQYRSLPRPSRSARAAAAGMDASLRTATLPKGRSTSAATKALSANGGGGGSNQTDREKGSEVDGLKTAGQGLTGSGRQAGGKYSEMSSPTLRRLVFFQLCLCVDIQFGAIICGIWCLCVCRLTSVPVDMGNTSVGVAAGRCIVSV